MNSCTSLPSSLLFPSRLWRSECCVHRDGKTLLESVVALLQPLYCSFSLPYFALTSMSALIGCCSSYITTTRLDIDQVPVLRLQASGRLLLKSLWCQHPVTKWINDSPQFVGGRLATSETPKIVQCEQGFRVQNVFLYY